MNIQNEIVAIWQNRYAELAAPDEVQITQNADSVTWTWEDGQTYTFKPAGSVKGALADFQKNHAPEILARMWLWVVHNLKGGWHINTKETVLADTHEKDESGALGTIEIWVRYDEDFIQTYRVSRYHDASFDVNFLKHMRKAFVDCAEYRAQNK